MNNWLDKPITWRSYLRLAGAVSLLYVIVYGCMTAFLWWDDLMETVKNWGHKVKTKFHRNGYPQMEDET